MEDENINVIQDYFNIVLIGDDLVGKSSVLDRYCNNKFCIMKKKHRPVEIYIKKINIDNRLFKLKLWDTKFTDTYFKMNKQIYDRADAIIFNCAIDNKDSLYHIKTWYDTLSERIDINLKENLILVNKIDLKEKKITKEELDKMSEELNVKYFEISAMEGRGIKGAFEFLILNMIKKIYKQEGKILEKKGKTENDGCAS